MKKPSAEDTDHADSASEVDERLISQRLYNRNTWRAKGGRSRNNPKDKAWRKDWDEKRKAKSDLEGLCKRCLAKHRYKSYVVCSECYVYQKACNRRKLYKLKSKTFAHYGGSLCQCCGESQLEFLTLDHINNDGAAFRRQFNRKLTGSHFYSWLRKNGYPDIDLQVLCANCQHGKNVNGGVCPHEEKLKALVPYNKSNHALVTYA